MKSKLTIKIERALTVFKKPDPNYKFVLVTTELNLAGPQRVDVARFEERRDHLVEMTCYEIKVSRSDFKSDHGHNFVGHKNYYVLPGKLAYQVEGEIPDDIGIIVYEKNRLYTRRECQTKQMSAERLSSYLFQAIKQTQLEDVPLLTHQDPEQHPRQLCLDL